jgi:hypothetical protein
LKSLAGRDAVKALAEGLTIERAPDAKANFLVLSFKGGDPKDGVTILAALIDAYQKFLDITYRNLTDQTLEFVVKARDLLQQDIVQMEGAYERFRLNAPLIKGAGKDAAVAQRETALQARKSALLIRRAEIQAREEALERAIAAGTDLEPLLKIWAPSSGFDKQPAKKPVEAAKAHIAVLRQEMEEARAIETSLDRLLQSVREEGREVQMFEFKDQRYHKDLERLQLLHDQVVKRLMEMNLVREYGGYDVRVLTPPHVAAANRQVPGLKKAEAVLATDLTGKVVFVQTAKDAVTLEKAQVMRLGERPFVVGRVLRDQIVTRGDFVGTTAYLPVSDITRIVVCDNLDQLKNSVTAR